MESELNVKKRDRSINFSAAETRCLIEICVKFKSVIENKKTDAVTNRDKEAAWIEIENMFNAISGTAARNKKALKLKYEGLKKSTKKKMALNRQQLYKTGGGAQDQIPYTPIEEIILGMSSNIGGLESRNDSDEVTGINISIPYPNVRTYVHCFFL